MRMRYLFAVMMAIACLCVGGVDARAKAIGHFSLVEGRVDVLKKGADKAVPVKLDDEVRVGDIVRTKSKSRAQIVLIDQSILRLAESSRMEVRRFMFSRGKENKRDGMFHMFRGQLRSIVHRSKDEQAFNFKVQTPTAVAAVRGTDWYSIVSSDAMSSFICKSGKVEVKSIDAKIPRTVVIAANQITTVAKGKPPAPPKQVSAAAVENMVSAPADEAPAADEETGGGEEAGGTGDSGQGGQESESESDDSETTDDSGTTGDGGSEGSGSGEPEGDSGTSGQSDSSTNTETTDTSSSTSTTGSKVGAGKLSVKKAIAAKVATAVKTNATSIGSTTTTAPSTTTTTPPITTTVPQILTAPVTIQVNF